MRMRMCIRICRPLFPCLRRFFMDVPADVSCVWWKHKRGAGRQAGRQRATVYASCCVSR